MRRVVRLAYAHNDPPFRYARVSAVPASNLQAARLLLTGEACCGFVPLTFAARLGLPVVPRLAVYSVGTIYSARLFRGSGSGYAAVEDTTVSAMALRLALGLEFDRVASVDGALARYAGVLAIGDEALRLVDRGVPHLADVGEAWRDRFGMPLVYAVFAASPRAQRGEVEGAVEELEGSLARFYEDPEPLAAEAAARLSVSRSLMSAYFSAVKYFVNGAVEEAMEREAQLFGLGPLRWA